MSLEVRNGEGELLGHVDASLPQTATMLYLCRNRSIVKCEQAQFALPIMRFLPDCRRAVNAGSLTRDELKHVGGFTPCPL